MKVLSGSPMEPLLRRQGFVLLDGGLATELESRGHSLETTLWSAELLRERPEAILAVHRSYLEAGADCVISASYQASFRGFAAHGLAAAEAERLIALSVDLAVRARDEVLPDPVGAKRRVMPPLVAASVGPFGAFLADGSEYRGDYGVTDAELEDFHADRWRVLAASTADVLACETLPNAAEARVLLEMLHRTPGRSAWFSFSCRDGKCISDGTPIREVASLFEGDPQVVAVGVNCTAPRHCPTLIEEVRMGAPTQEVIVYPNSGERYDGLERTWVSGSGPTDDARIATAMFTAGARLIGGCCRTTPGAVRSIGLALASL